MKNTCSLTIGFLILFQFFFSGAWGQKTAGKTTVQTVDTSKSKPVFPQPVGWVNDFEEVLDSATEAHLTKLIEDHNHKTSNQISIVTISSIMPYTYLGEYANDLANAWGVGERGKNNGVTIIYSKALHEARIATGYGLEKIVTNELCKKIVDEFMLPAFHKGDYGKGMIDGVTELIRILEKP